jgi:hypothetical protein
MKYNTGKIWVMNSEEMNKNNTDYNNKKIININQSTSKKKEERRHR